MRWIIGIFLTVFLVVGGVVLFRTWSAGTPAAVHREWKALVGDSELRRRESELAAAAQAREIANYFAREVTVGIREFPYRVESRADVGSVVYRARREMEALRVVTRAVEVAMESPGERARMACTLRLEGRWSGAWTSSWQTLDIRWVRTNGAWKINEVLTRDPLAGGGDGGGTQPRG